MAETKVVEVKSSPTPSLPPIESICVKQFYSPVNQLVEVDQPYVYFQDESEKDPLPYPWPLIRPIDPALHKEFSEEYFEWKKRKDDGIALKSDAGSDGMLRLAKILGKLAQEG